MRVLHLPMNVASQITDTVCALRENGIEARGMADAGHITANTGIEVLPDSTHDPLLVALAPFVGRPGVQRLLKRLDTRTRLVMDGIEWADVVHWYCARGLPGAVDIHYARHLGKKMLVEYAGSDIRIPEVEAADNPYYAEVWRNRTYEYKKESLANSRRHQRLFADAGAQVLIPYAALLPYVQHDLFPTVHTTLHRLTLTDYAPVYPDAANPRPLVIHSPSKIHTKGTPAVEAAVARLREAHAFDFTLVHGMAYDDARRTLQNCDIFLDQFVLGAHGVAALEAMALGKPVVCYIKPSLVDRYPADLPIVSATKETLPAVLGELLADGPRRAELGRQGRAYVERHHDARRLAGELATLYASL